MAKKSANDNMTGSLTDPILFIWDIDGTLLLTGGAGKISFNRVFGEHFEPWGLMVLPPGGFFVLGGWLLAFSWWKRRADAKTAGNRNG